MTIFQLDILDIWFKFRRHFRNDQWQPVPSIHSSTVWLLCLASFGDWRKIAASYLSQKMISGSFWWPNSSLKFLNHQKKGHISIFWAGSTALPAEFSTFFWIITPLPSPLATPVGTDNAGNNLLRLRKDCRVMQWAGIKSHRTQSWFLMFDNWLALSKEWGNGITW